MARHLGDIKSLFPNGGCSLKKVLDDIIKKKILFSVVNNELFDRRHEMRRCVFLSFLILCFWIMLEASYEEKKFSNATLGDDFHGSNVLVVLDKNISGFNKIHDEKLFGSFDKISVQDIFTINSQEVMDAIIEAKGEGEFRQIFQITLPYDDKKEVLNAIAELETIEGILYAGPNYFLQFNLVPDDPWFSSQWGPGSINAPLAWDITTGSLNTRVGIIDSGIDDLHPDILDNLESRWKFYGSWDPDTPPEPDTSPVSYGHGTHVAGIIGARG